MPRPTNEPWSQTEIQVGVTYFTARNPQNQPIVDVSRHSQASWASQPVDGFLVVCAVRTWYIYMCAFTLLFYWCILFFHPPPFLSKQLWMPLSGINVLPRDAAMLARSWGRNFGRPSVWHTHALCLWQNQTMHCEYFDTTRNSNHSSILTPTEVGGQRPRPSKICAQSDPLLRKTPTSTDFRL